MANCFKKKVSKQDIKSLESEANLHPVQFFLIFSETITVRPYFIHNQSILQICSSHAD